MLGLRQRRGLQSQAAGIARGVVSLPVSGPGVGELMQRDDAKNQECRGENGDDDVHRFSGPKGSQ